MKFKFISIIQFFEFRIYLDLFLSFTKIVFDIFEFQSQRIQMYRNINKTFLIVKLSHK